MRCSAREKNDFLAKFIRCVGEKAFLLFGHQEKHLKLTKTRSLRYPRHASDAMREFISSRDFFDRKSHCHTGNQSRLSSKYPLFLDQSEKSPDSGLATDE